MNPIVLIVGAGPVGLTMAIELTRYGVPVRIIDKSDHRTDKSKALVIWSRTLELIDRMGCTERFTSAGLKVAAANITAGREQIAHVTFDKLATPHPYALLIPQSETERLLEEHLESRGVRVERAVELTSFAADADHVTATLRHEGNRDESVVSQWLIGCDGAHSTVRHQLGLPFEGETLPSDWILADVHLTGRDDKWDQINISWHAEGVLLIFPISGGRYRVIADVGDGHGPASAVEPSLQQVQALLDRRGPGGLVASSPVWLAAFRINERKVADYRAGRTFLAGDAAHIHSPAGGQGMNTGMQDAFNLAWKLALVHHGSAVPEPLLGSYSTERSAVGRQVLADAGRLTALALIRGGIKQSIRNHVASLIFGFAPVRAAMADKLSELSIGYPHSPLTRPGPHIQGGPVAGQRAPVSDTNEPIGAGPEPMFVLRGRAGAEADALIARYPRLVEKRPHPPFTEKGIWVVRPDGYIATVAAADDWAAIDGYLRSISSAAPRH